LGIGVYTNRYRRFPPGSPRSEPAIGSYLVLFYPNKGKSHPRSAAEGGGSRVRFSIGSLGNVGSLQLPLAPGQARRKRKMCRHQCPKAG